jgi:pimeloyl-ACP methyl ester carboxylesterase
MTLTRSLDGILTAMARTPETHYAKGPGGDIAYQVVGDGPIDLVVVPGWTSHVDLMWAAPGWARFNDELASFARVIFYDKLGTGLSDPIVELPVMVGGLAAGVATRRVVVGAAGIGIGLAIAVVAHLFQPGTVRDEISEVARHPIWAIRAEVHRIFSRSA